MKPAPFAYVRPTDLGEAMDALAADPHAKVLAGGQSLVPLMSMRLATPSTVVDINGLPGLSFVEADGNGVRIGALARHAAVERDAAARRAQPLLSQALRMVAHATIRNRGTTVGSLVHADASGEMPVVLCLLGGSVTAVSASGSRAVAADELYVGPLETSLRHDELVTEAWLPRLSDDSGVAFDEVARRHGDYAMCGVAALVDGDGSGAVASVRAAYLSMADVPVVLDLTEAFADGPGRPTAAALDEAADRAAAALDPGGDIHASAHYRRHLARVLTRRVVAAAFDHREARQASRHAEAAR